MRISELDDIEKEVLLGAVVERARADLNEGRPLTEMRASAEDLWCGSPTCRFCKRRGLIPEVFADGND